MFDALAATDRLFGAVRQEPVSAGLSGARVLQLLDATGRPVAVVKAADEALPHVVADLQAEVARLQWLNGLGALVPALLQTGSEQGFTWAAMTVLPGRAASDPWPEDRRDWVVDALAAGLRALHALSTADCPFDRSLPTAVLQARQRTEAGLVDRSWQIAGKVGPPAVVVLKELETLAERLGAGEAAVCHGDFALPNALVDERGLSGMVDLGRAGLADPHSDVADVLRSLRSHMNPQFGEVYAQRFLDNYGRERILPERLALHDLVESFYWPVPVRVAVSCPREVSE